MSSHWNKDAAFIDLELKPNTIIAAKPSDLVTWAFMKRQKGPYIILSILHPTLKISIINLQTANWGEMQIKCLNSEIECKTKAVLPNGSQ